MKPLFKPEELWLASSYETLPLECQQCHRPFQALVKRIRQNLKGYGGPLLYCNHTCKGASMIRSFTTQCGQCGIDIVIRPTERLNSKSSNNFCSKSCAATYNNTHKTIGIRRSKLEMWLEEQLPMLYPDLELIFNDKETINSELDIYLPELKLAFELNGIFHYEPIYGPEKLASIQNNDGRKFQACLEREIELVIIDTSSLNNFRHPKNDGAKYLNIIRKVIEIKLEVLKGVEPSTIS
jgi:hypothetical protein